MWIGAGKQETLRLGKQSERSKFSTSSETAKVSLGSTIAHIHEELRVPAGGTNNRVYEPGQRRDV